MEATLLLNIGIIICIVAVVTYIVKALKQPLILGYILGGILLGPAVLNVFRDTSIVMSIYELAVTFMLFIIGMELDFKHIKYIGKDVLLASLIQLAIVGSITFVISMAFHFQFRESILIGVIIFFNSTMLLAKWLDERKTTDAMYGRMAIGCSIMQDLFAIVGLSLLMSTGEFSFVGSAISIGKGIVLVLLAIILTKLLFKPLNFASKDNDLLFIISLALCFALAFIATYFGYSMSIGAFMAGMVLANFPYKLDLHPKFRTLATFFNVLFLAGLGMYVTFDYGKSALIYMGIILVILHLVKPFVVFFSFKVLGYDSKSSFLAGMNMANASEFGLILNIAAVASNLISPVTFGIVILFTIVSMVLSSYIVKYDIELYYKFLPFLRFFDKFFPDKMELKAEKKALTPEILIVGYEGIDPNLMNKFKISNKTAVIIENDHYTREQLQKQGFTCLYGSADNPDLLGKIDFSKITILISTSKEKFENLNLVRQLKLQNKHAVAIQYAANIEDAAALYDAGTDYVIYPTLLGEDKISVLIEDYEKDINSLLGKKLVEIEKLNRRKELIKEKQEATSYMLDIDNFVKNIQSKKEVHDRIVQSQPKVIIEDLQKKEEPKPTASFTPLPV
ncbi:MAG: cation:proton antiporter [archaeon]